MKGKIDLSNFEHELIRLFYVCMLFLVFLQILTRYIIGRPLGWTEELSRFSYIWITFIGAGYCVKSKTNVKVMVFVNKLPYSVRQKFIIFGNSLVSAMLLYLLPSSVNYSIIMLRRESPALKIPMFYVYISVVISFLLIIIRLSIESFEIYKSLKKGVIDNEIEQNYEGGAF